MLRSLAATWLSLAPSEPGQAHPASVLDLQWNAPSECAAQSHVEAAFVRYVGDEATVEVAAIATIVRTDDGYRLDLNVSGHHKQVDSTTCDALSEAAAVILSIAATEPESLEASSTPAEPTETSPTDPSPTETSPTDPSPTDPSPDNAVLPAKPEPPPAPAQPDFHPAGARGSVRVEAGFRFGVMPSFGADTSLALGVLWPRMRLELAGTFWTPREQVLDTAADTVVLATLGSVEARGCWTPYRRRFEFPLCAGFELGAARTDAGGSAPARVQHGLWAGASLGAAMVWLIRPTLGLWVGTEAVVALRRPSFAVAESSYRPGPAAVRGFLGLELRFPSRQSALAGNRTR